MSSSGRGRGRARSASPPASSEASSGDESGTNWQRVVAERFTVSGGVWQCQYKRRSNRFDKKGQLSWQTMLGTAPSKVQRSHCGNVESLLATARIGGNRWWWWKEPIPIACLSRGSGTARHQFIFLFA